MQHHAVCAIIGAAVTEPAVLLHALATKKTATLRTLREIQRNIVKDKIEKLEREKADKIAEKAREEKATRRRGQSTTNSDANSAVLDDPSLTADGQSMPVLPNLHDIDINVLKGHATTTTVLSSGATVTTDFTIVSTEEELHVLAPNVVLLLYSAGVPQTFDAAEGWAKEIDKLFPRPFTCLVGTQGDRLPPKAAKQAVIAAKKKRSVFDGDDATTSGEDHRRGRGRGEGVTSQSDEPQDDDDEEDIPLIDANGILTVEAIDDLYTALRCVAAVECSAAAYTNVLRLEESIAKAVAGEPDRRVTPEALQSMRAACIDAAAKIGPASVWTARRDQRTGRVFYFNLQTRQPQWVRPPDFDGTEPEMSEEERRQIEALQRRQEQEQQQQRHEATVQDEFQRSLVEHADRMKRMEVRTDALVRQIAELESVKEQLVQRQDELKKKRQKLEEQRDGDVAAALETLPRFLADDEAALEKELAQARMKMQELEVIESMREERAVDVHVAEERIKSKMLQGQIHSALQSQLDIQRENAEIHAKIEVAKREKARCTQQAAVLLSKRGEIQRAVVKEKQAIDDLRLEVRTAQNITDEAVQKLKAFKQTPLTDAAKQRRLIDACHQLDASIADLRATKTNHSLGAIQDEVERLKREQTALITDVATKSARAAAAELLMRKQFAAHTDAMADFEVASNQALRRATFVRDTTKKKLDEESSKERSYIGATTADVERMVTRLNSTWSRTTTLSGQEIATSLSKKLADADKYTSKHRLRAEAASEQLRKLQRLTFSHKDEAMAVEADASAVLNRWGAELDRTVAAAYEDAKRYVDNAGSMLAAFDQQQHQHQQQQQTSMNDPSKAVMDASSSAVPKSPRAGVVPQLAGTPNFGRGAAAASGSGKVSLGGTVGGNRPLGRGEFDLGNASRGGGGVRNAFEQTSGQGGAGGQQSAPAPAPVFSTVHSIVQWAAPALLGDDRAVAAMRTAFSNAVLRQTIPS